MGRNSIIIIKLIEEKKMDPMNNPTPTPNLTPSSDPTGAMGAGSVPNADLNFDSSASTGTPSNAASAPNITPNSAPTNPVANSNFQSVGMMSTDPIMRPEPAKAPDPVEEELKAPMKAADPVPGSIGSAVSGPDNGGVDTNPMGFPENNSQTPSVPFNDPAMQPDSAIPSAQPTKKKANRKTLIILIAVAAVIVVILAIILIVQLTSGSGSSASSSSNSSSSASSAGVADNTDVAPPAPADNIDNGDMEAPDVPAASLAIVCSAESLQDGNTVNSNITFQIENNKIVNVAVDAIVTDENGESVSDSQTLSFGEVIGDAMTDGEDDFLDTDGTLLVPADELSGELEAALNISSDMVYSCYVN